MAGISASYRPHKPSNVAIAVVASILGILVGIDETEHGSCELLQGNVNSYFSSQKLPVVKCALQLGQSPTTMKRHVAVFLVSDASPHFGHLA